MRKHNIFAYCLQETWVSGSEDLRCLGSVILQHGLSQPVCARGSQGVAIVLSPEAEEARQRAGGLKFTFGPRIVATRLTLLDANKKEVKIFLVSSYAPNFKTNLTSDAELQQYYQQLDECVNFCKSDEVLIIGTDANASIGVRTDDIGFTFDGQVLNDRVTGKYGNPHMNQAGLELRKFCACNQLCAPSTFFQKPHYDTWQHPGKRCKKGYQIDHFLVRRDDLRRVRDCGRVKTSGGGDSDHLPVTIDFRLARNLRRRALTHSQLHDTVINKVLLQSPQVAGAFRLSVKDLFEVNKAEILALSHADTVLTVDEQNDALTRALLDAAADVLTEESIPQKGWFQLRESDLDKAIQLRNSAQTACFLNKQDVSLREALRKARSVVKKEVARTKNLWFVLRMNELESFQHPRVYWQAFRQLKRGIGESEPITSPSFYSPDDPTSLCNTAAANIEAAVKHCDKVYNIHATFSAAQLNRVRQRVMWDGNTDRPDFNQPPSRKMIRAALQKCKNDKACGVDKTAPEYFKALSALDDTDGFEVFVTLLHSIWEAGYIPKVWKKNKLVLVYKNKGDKHVCDNYRGIALKPLANKILGSCIQMRISDILREEGLLEQFGFTAECGSDDASFCLKTALQRRAEHGLGTFVAFIDLVKAFDSVPREALYLVLAKYGVPKKMLDIIVDMHTDVEFELNIAREKRSFISNTGVLQGATEAPVLFLLYIQACLEVYDADTAAGHLEHEPSFLTAHDLVLAGRKTKCPPTNTETFTVPRSLYADDGAFLWESRPDLASGLHRLYRILKDFGLLMHVGTPDKASKTECMYFPPSQLCLDKSDPKYLERRSRVEERTAPCAACTYQLNMRGVLCHRHRGREPHAAALHPAYSDADLSPITIGPGTVPFVSQFKYLGSIIHFTLKDDLEIKARILAASAAFGSAKNFLCDRRLSLKERVRMFAVHVISILCFGCAHWALSEALKRALLSFFYSCLRRILAVSRAHVWKEGVTNAELLALAHTDDLEVIIVRHRLTWLGKVLRMGMSKLPRKLLSSWVDNPRPPGLPQMGICSSYLKDCAAAGLDIASVPALSLKRDKWRQLLKSIHIDSQTSTRYAQHLLKHSTLTAEQQVHARRQRCTQQQEHSRKKRLLLAQQQQDAATQGSQQRAADKVARTSSPAPTHSLSVVPTVAPPSKPTTPPPAPRTSRAGRSIRARTIMDL